METAEILSLTDMQGMPVSLVRLNIYDSFFAYIADFPIGEHSWVNITMDFPEEDMDKVRGYHRDGEHFYKRGQRSARSEYKRACSRHGS